MTAAQAEKLKKLEAAYERAYKHGGEVALFNAQTALERFEAALERSEKLKAAGLRSRSNPRRQKVKGNTRRRVNAASSTGKMIPAKVMVGKGGKVRVFVNPKHLTGLHQSGNPMRNPMTLITGRIKSKLRDGVPGDTTHLLTAPIIDSKGVILFRRGTAFIPLSGGLHGDRAYAAIGIGGQRREFEWDRK